MAFYERSGSRTEMRELRSKIRHGVGVTSEPVPSAERLIRAAQDLDRMLQLATNGDLRLSLEAGKPFRTPTLDVGNGEPVGWADAISAARAR